MYIICVHTFVHIYIYIFVYTYVQRERERERERACIHKYVCADVGPRYLGRCASPAASSREAEPWLKSSMKILVFEFTINIDSRPIGSH